MTDHDWLINHQRLDKWIYIIESLVGGMDDEGILKWLNTYGPDLDKMVKEAEQVRDGMIAT